MDKGEEVLQAVLDDIKAMSNEQFKKDYEEFCEYLKNPKWRPISMEPNTNRIHPDQIKECREAFPLKRTQFKIKDGKVIMSKKAFTAITRRILDGGVQITRTCREHTHKLSYEEIERMLWDSCKDVAGLIIQEIDNGIDPLHHHKGHKLQ